MKASISVTTFIDGSIYEIVGQFMQSKTA